MIRQVSTPRPSKGQSAFPERMVGANLGTHENPKEFATQGHRTRNPTTSFLTAATLIYAIGAGITAAAGQYDPVAFARTDWAIP